MPGSSTLPLKAEVGQAAQVSCQKKLSFWGQAVGEVVLSLPVQPAAPGLLQARAVMPPGRSIALCPPAQVTILPCEREPWKRPWIFSFSSYAVNPSLICPSHSRKWASLVAQRVKNPPAMWDTWAWSLGWEDPLEEGMATHSSVLAWRIPTEEPGGLQSIGSKRVGHDWATKHSTAHSTVRDRRLAFRA